MKRFALTLFLVATLPAVALADDAQDMSAWFERLKGLEGEWIQQGEMMNGAKVVYHVSSGGSVLVETLFPGTDHEMVTMYHLDGADLVLTHYCHLGNRPHMKSKTAAENVLEFECTGLSSGEEEAHMHAARIELAGPDKIVARWTLHQDGKAGNAVELTLARVGVK